MPVAFFCGATGAVLAPRLQQADLPQQPAASHV
jgi:hypothetical protein